MRLIFAVAATVGLLGCGAPALAQNGPGASGSDVTVHPRRPHRPVPRAHEGWNDGTYNSVWREGPFIYPFGYNYSEVAESPGAAPANGNGDPPMLPSQPAYAPADLGYPIRGLGGDLLHSN